MLLVACRLSIVSQTFGLLAVFSSALVRGDVVYMRSDTTCLPYIALLEDIDSEGSSLLCRWFYRYSEVKFSDASQKKMLGVSANLKNELFLSTIMVRTRASTLAQLHAYVPQYTCPCRTLTRWQRYWVDVQC